MHRYTVMRHATVEDSHGNGSCWVVWDADADTPQQAVESAADVAGEYIVLEADPAYFTVGPHTELRVVDGE